MAFRVSRREMLGGLGLVLAGFDVACKGAATPTAEAWATGGTKAMTLAASYPDPFVAGAATSCDLVCAATIGPCYAKTVERKDISEGMDGLPVRMVFLVVDKDCKPVPNAGVDVWHCAPNGLYSGDDASDFCTSGDKAARAARYFRGTQTSAADGKVSFDTVFPGWYRGRTVHVHFTIRIGKDEYVTSQLVFDDDLVDTIVEGHPAYAARGKRDTKNHADNVVGNAKLSNHTFETKRMPDGAMLIWKKIAIRSAPSDKLCTAGFDPESGAPPPPGKPGTPPPNGAGGPPPGPPPGAPPK